MILCLTLGHNASAVLIPLRESPIGYEEERLSKVKSDSSFPIKAIEQIFNHVGLDQIARVKQIFISHWFDKFNPYTAENKYYSASKIKELFPNAELVSTATSGVSHHEAHALSVLAFFRSSGKTVFQDVLIAVVDGFGNHQEVASLYRVASDDTLIPVKKVRGYGNSMGLLYQYAATAAGMDGINDVYKFLGYRTHLVPSEKRACDALADQIAERFKTLYRNASPTASVSYMDHDQGLIDYELLKAVRSEFEGLFASVIDHDEFMSRVRIGYVVQEVLERTVIEFLDTEDFKHLLVAGGVFYNVRLNDKLRKAFSSSSFCAMPLAGDQGAALGLAYSEHTLISKAFTDLCWGHRKLSSTGSGVQTIAYDGAATKIADLIAEGYVVNIAHGNMEFGPRALCHTSSLALCKRELVDGINTANGRTTVMPMAPVMLSSIGLELFNAKDVTRTVNSDRFMVTAHDFLDQVQESELGGAMHKDLDGSYSGRPQFVDRQDGLIYQILCELLEKHKIRAVINTSLNIHGEPIVYDGTDLEKTHDFWLRKCPVPFKTFIIKGEHHD